MSCYQRLSALVDQISGGLRYLESQIEEFGSAADARQERWTLTLNKVVPKRSKPAQVVDSKGRALLDRMQLHSLLADLAGIGEGGLDVRARLAQAGESIDRLFDSQQQIQMENCEIYDLTKKDARRGLSFGVFLIILTALKPPEVSQTMARQLFDEFAGTPTDTEALVVVDTMTVVKMEKTCRPGHDAAAHGYAEAHAEVESNKASFHSGILQKLRDAANGLMLQRQTRLREEENRCPIPQE